jgi:hypothetical protein
VEDEMPTVKKAPIRKTKTTTAKAQPRKKAQSKAAAKRKARNPTGKTSPPALENKLRMKRINPRIQTVMAGELTKSLRHPANTRGDVSLYNLATMDIIHELVYAVGMRGGTKTEMCKEIGISYDRFMEWQVQYPEFGEAIDLAVMASQVDWEHTLRDQARGHIEGGNATAAIFAMKNMFPENYKDRRDVNVQAQGTVTIDFSGIDGAPLERQLPDPDGDVIEGEVYRG